MSSTSVNTAPRRMTCAEVFFRCLETLPGDGSGGMVDDIRGCEFNLAAQNPGDGLDPATIGAPANPTYWMENGVTPVNSVRPKAATSVYLTQGTWPNFGQKAIILFSCGIVYQPGILRIPFGDGASFALPARGNISVSLAGEMHVAATGAEGGLLGTQTQTGLTLGLERIGEFVGVIGEYLPATTDGVTVTEGSFHAKVVGIDGTTLLSSSDGVTPLDIMVPVDTVGDITSDQTNCSRFAGLDFYSIMAFSFANGLPSNRETVYKWLMRQHAIENRVLPPHWAYTT